MRASANRETGPCVEGRPTALARLSEASDADGEMGGWRPALSASDSSEPDAEMADDGDGSDGTDDALATGRVAVISEASAASEPDDETPPSNAGARGAACAP
jgi:hypothetical protein